jgi:hypothetical protein
MDIIEVKLENFFFTFQFDKSFFEKFKDSRFDGMLLDEATKKELIVNVYTTKDDSLSAHTYGNGFCGYIIPIQFEQLNAGKLMQANQKMDEELRRELREFWGNEENKRCFPIKVEAMLNSLESTSFTSCYLHKDYWLSNFDLYDLCQGKEINIFSPSPIEDFRVNHNSQHLIHNRQDLLRLVYFDKANGYGCTFKSIATILDYKNSRNVSVFDWHFQFLPTSSMPKKNDLVLALLKQIRLESLTHNYGELNVSSKTIAPQGLPNKNNFCCFNTAINMITQIFYEAKIEFSIHVADIFSECSFYMVSLHTDAVELITYLLEKEKISQEIFTFLQCHEYCQCISSNTKINETIRVEVTVLAISYPSLTQHLSYDASPLFCFDDFGLVGFCIFIPNKNERSKAGMTGEYNIIQRGHYVSYRLYEGIWYSLDDSIAMKITIEEVVKIFVDYNERITFCVYNKDKNNKDLLLECKSSIEKQTKNQTNIKRVREYSSIEHIRSPCMEYILCSRSSRSVTEYSLLYIGKTFPLPKGFDLPAENQLTFTFLIKSSMPSTNDIVCPKSLQEKYDKLYVCINGDKYIFKNEDLCKLPKSSQSWVCSVLKNNKVTQSIPELSVSTLLDMLEKLNSKKKQK